MKDQPIVEITQAEKLAVLKNDLASREATSLFERQVQLEAQSKFPASLGTTYPRQPANSPWSCDPCGKERPLNIDIHKVGDCA
jgi:hypothetical protein